MNLVPWRKRPSVEVVERDASMTLADWNEWFDLFNFQSVQYSYGTGSTEDVGGGYQSLARGAYKGDSVVFACMNLRASVFSEARFMFRRMRSGRPGDMFGTPELNILNNPWPGGTTGDLLARMIQYADLAGNAFVVRSGNRLVLLRPDWVSIVAGSNDPDSTAWDVDADVLGYVYQEGGPGAGKDPIVFMPDQVAHFAPVPDPEARFRGMSWLTPVLREIQADKAMTEHKISFLEHGATPNLLMKLNVNDLEKYKQLVADFKKEHEGVRGAYKTIFLAAGMDAVPVGANFQQIDFKATQGAGETRVAAAAGTPPIIVGLSEGLQGSSLNAGNYQAAKRRFADGTMSNLWRNAAGSLARIVNVPSDAELWYDRRDIAFLREDEKDAAEIMNLHAAAINTFVSAGYTQESAVDAVSSGDLRRLVGTGLVSVQLQKPGVQKPAASGTNSNRTDDAMALVEELIASLPSTEG